MSNSARSTFLIIHDGPGSTDRMSWPNPYDPKEIEWKLRYAPHSLDRSDQLVAAGLISAYSSLIGLPQKVRNRRVEQIKKALAGEQ